MKRIIVSHYQRESTYNVCRLEFRCKVRQYFLSVLVNSEKKIGTSLGFLEVLITILALRKYTLEIYA